MKYTRKDILHRDYQHGDYVTGIIACMVFGFFFLSGLLMFVIIANPSFEDSTTIILIIVPSVLSLFFFLLSTLCIYKTKQQKALEEDALITGKQLECKIVEFRAAPRTDSSLQYYYLTYSYTDDSGNEVIRKCNARFHNKRLAILLTYNNIFKVINKDDMFLIMDIK